LRRFLKKVEKTPKTERDSCMPRPKNGERPYLVVPKPTFWDPFLGLFSALFRRILDSLILQHFNITHLRAGSLLDIIKIE